MQGVMTTPLAVLLELKTIGVILLVFLGRVIAALALRAGQSDQSTHEYSFLLILLLNGLHLVRLRRGRL